MRIVITGGTGFIGKRLVPLLLKRGHEILLLGRTSSANPPMDCLSFQQCNLADPASYRAHLDEYGPEAACHLAWEGIPDFSIAQCDRNLGLGRTFLNEVFRLPTCRRIVTVGSCWEYGDRQGICSEEIPAIPANDFTRAKETLRRTGLEHAARLGKAFGWFRIFYVYGPGQRAESLIPSVIAILREGQEFAPKHPQAAQDFIYVDDVAEGLAQGLEQEWFSGEFNLGSGVLTSVSRIAPIIAKLMKYPASGNDIQPELPDERDLSGCWASTERAWNALGWRAKVGIEEGLQRTLHAINLP